jgi:CBS domain containing-hemolysin-like protein
MIIATLVIIVLILLNALFVAAEFAIVGAPRAAMDRLAANGNRAARMVARVLHDPKRTDRFIATAQLGITLASLGLGMYGEHTLAAWLAERLELAGAGRWIAAHTIATIVAVSVLTYFHIVIGEMVPKTLALHRADRVALWIAPVIRVVQIATLPLVLLLNGAGNLILRLLGIERSGAGSEYFRTPEEISYLVRESQAGGLLRREAAQVIHELLEFGDLTAGAVMVPRVRVKGIPLEASVEQLQAALASSPHTRYPVYRDTVDSVVGMVHVKDVLRCISGRRPLTREMVREVPFVPEAAIMDEVIGAMRRNRSHLAIVMDEHGGTAGLITLEDLFEEVVGEIGEGAAALPEIVRESATRVYAVGTARVEDVGTALGVVLEHEDVETVSGLVLTLLGRPAEDGDVVIFEGVEFRVTAVDGRGVGRCTITLITTTHGQ